MKRKINRRKHQRGCLLRLLRLSLQETPAAAAAAAAATAAAAAALRIKGTEKQMHRRQTED